MYLLNDIILYHEGNIVLLYVIIEILDFFQVCTYYVVMFAYNAVML